MVIDGKAYVSNLGGVPRRLETRPTTPTAPRSHQWQRQRGGLDRLGVRGGPGHRHRGAGLPGRPRAERAARSGATLLVTNTDDDTITSIDTAKQQLGPRVRGEPRAGRAVRGAAQRPDHARPGASGGQPRPGQRGRHLQLPERLRPAELRGPDPDRLVPWGIAQDRQLNRLVVASEQGVGSVGADGTIAEGVAPCRSPVTWATTSSAPCRPSRPRRASRSRNTPSRCSATTSGTGCGSATGGAAAPPGPSPSRWRGDPSTIKHVFLIVKENRIYDQVLGDDPRGNGDPSLAQCGARSRRTSTRWRTRSR